MVTTIINPPTQDYPVLTSAIGPIKASTDKSKVLVEIVRDPEGEIDLFFSTTLYPYDNIVELNDIGSLIEDRLRAVNRIWDMIEIRIDGATAEFTALYCEYLLAPDFRHDTCFLCSAATSIVHRNSAISLAHWDNGSKEYQVKVVGLDEKGKTVALSAVFYRTLESNHVSFSVNDILDFALNRSSIETGDVISSVSYFAISHGAIQKVFYLMDHPFFLTFCFRNIFNAIEYVDIAGLATRITKVNRDTAYVAGRMQQYDQTIERSFEMHTGPLTADQVKEIEQLVGSRTIYLCASDRDYRVMITDHTLEYDNDDESLPSAKFTFCFADKRPVLTSGDIGALLPSGNHIFTHEFTAEFS
ncbi:hypothetical protein [Duncaniella muris]|jgi:hypothetical protein|uniref:hypothetical protein n=1 Tax=Duncaniella muris TaxID=2094150 RepID=UPI0026757901|nr:hypothetical protein [Duncaniella muris]